jgi:hypothetical protein
LGKPAYGTSLYYETKALAVILSGAKNLGGGGTEILHSLRSFRMTEIGFQPNERRKRVMGRLRVPELGFLPHA